MSNSSIEKGDIIALKDGREVEVLSVKPDYEKGDGAILRFDYVDRKEASPMRRTEYPSKILRVLRRAALPLPDPKVVRPYDNPVIPPTEVIVVNGQEYIKKDKAAPAASTSPESIINQEAGPQVHPAVKAPAKPVGSRIKKADKPTSASK